MTKEIKITLIIQTIFLALIFYFSFISGLLYLDFLLAVIVIRLAYEVKKLRKLRSRYDKI